MRRNSRVKRAGIIIVVAAIVVVAAAAVTYSSGAKALGPGSVLFVQAVGHEQSANSGNSHKVGISVAVNSSNGPLEGIPKGNFELRGLAVPRGGSSEMVGYSDRGNGFYLLEVVPLESGGSPWVKGLYIFGILVKTPVGWGIALAEVLIDVHE